MPQTDLLKALCEAGIASRRKLADAICEDRVKVNGRVVNALRFPVNPDTDRVSIDDQMVNLKPEPVIYLLMNKPAGVISTTSDEKGRKTVKDILPKRYRAMRVYPVGRLDADSTGLVLLTNDGRLTYRLTHPSFEHEKEYMVEIDGKLEPAHKHALERGIDLDDGLSCPARVRAIQPRAYSITIHEGRKHQVRRMFESLGYRVLALKRTRLGRLELGDLPEGRVRELTPEEVRSLHMRESG